MNINERHEIVDNVINENVETKSKAQVNYEIPEINNLLNWKHFQEKLLQPSTNLLIK